MKKTIITLIIIVSLTPVVQAQNSSLWSILSSGKLRPIVQSWGLQIPSLGSTGNPCIKVGATGVFGTTTCGGGASLSGGTTNALTYWTSPTTVGATTSPVVGYITATSTTATSTFPIASSTCFWNGTTCLNGGTPAGSNYQFQFNNGGVFGGSSKLYTDIAGVTLTDNYSTLFGAGVDFQGNTVSNIGTGQGFLYQQSNGIVVGSTSPVIGYITATSTATSTFTGAIQTGNYVSSDGTTGFTGTCTILGLTSIVVKNGLIVSCN